MNDKSVQLYEFNMAMGCQVLPNIVRRNYQIGIAMTSEVKSLITIDLSRILSLLFAREFGELGVVSRSFKFVQVEGCG